MDSKVIDTLLPLGGEIDLGGKTLKIIKRLGGGLTSEVYQGELLSEGSPSISVALKAMKALDLPTARQAFEQESLTLAMLMHFEQERANSDNAVLNKLNLIAPKIAPTYYGKDEYKGTPFIVMEFIQGKEIIDLLSKKGSLTEQQALVASWHLYRILDILHTDLKKSFIDLKFQNLWWVDSDGSGFGQLKITDFGTLEEIKPPNTRGIKRDVLLAAVYFFAMLTGHTLKYSLGELQERAEPLLKANKDKLTWGTYQLLRHLLHRNPDQRLESAKAVASELQNLLSLWNGGNQILKDAEDRLNVAENRKESDPERAGNLARLARAALDVIPRLGHPYDPERLEMDIRRADEVLALSDYLERSKNLFNGRAYDLALENLEKGMKWSDDPAPLRRLAYLCVTGKVVPTNLFDPSKDDVIKITDLMNLGRWTDAIERLDSLRTRLASPGMDALWNDCELFFQLENAEQLRTKEQFNESAGAYRQAMAALEKLPYKEIVKGEEVGDLLTIAQEMEALDRTRGEALRLIQAAKVTLKQGDIYSAISKAREAFTFDRENRQLLINLNDLARQALIKFAFGPAIQFIEISMNVPKPPEDLLNTLALARILNTAEQARKNRDRQTFFSALGEVQLKYSQDPAAADALKKLLEEAENWAKSTGEAAFLISLAEFHENVIKNADHANELRDFSNQTKSQQSEQRKLDVDRLLGDVTVLYYLDRPEHGTEAAARWTAVEFYGKLKNRAAVLEDALHTLSDAQTIASPIGYKQEEINQWTEWLKQVLKTVENSLSANKVIDADRLSDIQSRWLEVSNLRGDEKKTALKEFLYQVYRYLYEIDAASEPALQLKAQALQACDRFGQTGWQDLQTLSTRRLEEIRSQFAEAQHAFQNGDLPKTMAELERLLPLYNEAEEWMNLKIKVFQTLSWQSWLRDNGQRLQAGQADIALLSTIRQYRRYQIPAAYWLNSPVYAYLKTARGNALQTLKQTSVSQRVDFLNALTIFLNMDWSDRFVRGDAETSQNWDTITTQKFLRNIAIGIRDAGMGSVDKYIQTISPPANIDEVLVQLKPENWSSVARETGGVQRKPFPLGQTTLVSVALVFLGLYLLITGGAFGYCMFNKTGCINAVATPEVVILKATRIVKETIVVAGPTAVSQPEAPTLPPPTPIPYSITYITHPETIYPPVPIKGKDVWLLDDKDVYTRSGIGQFDPKDWIQANSSDPKGTKEPFYYTDRGEQFVFWMMEETLYSGLYQLYVSDTMNESAGEQTYKVTLNGIPAQPFRGTGKVTLADEKRQTGDDWISIGAYEVNSGDRLRVLMEVGPRETDKPFAVDRLLVVKVEDNERTMLEGLPQGRELVSLLDDDRTNYAAGREKDHWGRFYESPAWNDSYIARADERKEDVNLIWRSAGMLPAGVYQLYVWLPEKETTINNVEYMLLADGTPVSRPAPGQIDQNALKGWYDLSIWTLEYPAAVSVKLVVKPDAAGTIGVDAVAILRAGDIAPAQPAPAEEAAPAPAPTEAIPTAQTTPAEGVPVETQSVQQTPAAGSSPEQGAPEETPTVLPIPEGSATPIPGTSG